MRITIAIPLLLLVCAALGGCDHVVASPIEEEVETEIGMLEMETGDAVVVGWHEFAVDRSRDVELSAVRADVPPGLLLEDVVVVVLEQSDAVVGSVQGTLSEVVPPGRVRALEGYRVSGEEFYIAFQYRLTAPGCHAVEDIVLEWSSDGRNGLHELKQQHVLSDGDDPSLCSR